MRNIFILIFLLLCQTLTAQSQRYYVNTQALPSGDGLSWGTAFKDLQDALVLADSGDEIWVAEGTYYPSQTNNRYTHFELKSGLPNRVERGQFLRP